MIYGNNIQLDKIGDVFGVRISKKEFPTSNMTTEDLTGKVNLLYFYKLGGLINYGGVIDGSNEKLYNIETEEWICAKDIEDEFSREVPPLEITISNMGKYIENIKNNYKTVLNISLDNKNSNINTKMYPISGSTKIYGDWWLDLSGKGSIKAVVYATKVYYGSTSYWDLATSMIADPESDYAVFAFLTATDVNYHGEDVTDYVHLPSNTGSLSVSLSGGIPDSVSYSTSTADLECINKLSDKTFEWTGIPQLYLGIFYRYGETFKLEPALRASNTIASANFIFKRNLHARFIDRLKLSYATPYYTSEFIMDEN